MAPSGRCGIFKRLYLAYFWVYYTKLKDFVKLVLHFMTMWIAKLVPNPSRFENRQWGQSEFKWKG